MCNRDIKESYLGFNDKSPLVSALEPNEQDEMARILDISGEIECR